MVWFGLVLFGLFVDTWATLAGVVIGASLAIGYVLKKLLWDNSSNGSKFKQVVNTLCHLPSSPSLFPHSLSLKRLMVVPLHTVHWHISLRKVSSHKHFLMAKIVLSLSSSNSSWKWLPRILPSMVSSSKRTIPFPPLTLLIPLSAIR